VGATIDVYTGIAFVNVEAGNATVGLSAIDANGNQVAARMVMLNPGQKSVGLVNQLFEADVTNARYIKFTSDRNVLGFTVSGSADGLMLEGLHSLDQYLFTK
jgi:hypothetical protein